MAAKRVIIYCRKSGSDDPIRDGLGEQERVCLAYAQEKGYEVVDVLKEAESGQPGNDPDAPMMKEAIRLASLGVYDSLLCRDVDRYTRSLGLGITNETQLNSYGVTVEFIGKEYDPGSEKIIKAVEYFAAEFERKKATERMATGREKMLRLGSLIGRTPLGIETEKVNGIYVAHIVEDEAKIIRTIFSWYVDRQMSARAIAKKLNRDKYPSSEGGAWAAWTVLRILRDETYAGKYRYGRRKTEKKRIPKGRKIATRYKYEMHPKDHHVIIPVPRIIDPVTWEKAQRRLEANKNDYRGRPAKYQYLMRRRCKCGNCDCSAHGNANKKGKYLYYTCEWYRIGDSRMSDNCFKFVAAGDVDETIWTWLESLLRDKNLLKAKLEMIRQDWLARYKPLEIRLDHIRAELERRKKAYDRLIELIISGGEYHLLADKKLALEREIDALEAEQLSTGREMQAISHIIYQADAGDAVELFEIDDKPLDFEDKRGYVEKFDVKAVIIKRPDGIWLEVSSNLGSMVQKMSHNELIALRFPYLWVITDMIPLEAR